MLLHRAGYAALVGGADQEHTHALEVAQHGAGQGGSLLGVGAGAQLVHQHQRATRGPAHNVDKVGDVGTERREGLLDALLVADVGIDAVEPRKAGLIRGYVQPGVGHHRQQAHGLEGHGLAAGVGTGDQQNAAPGVQRQADRHHVARQQRMPGAAEAHTARLVLLPVAYSLTLWGRVRVGAIFLSVFDDRRCGTQRRRVAGLGHVQVQPGHDVQGKQQVFGGLADAGGKLAQHALHLALLGQPGLAPAVAHVHGGHRLDKHRRAAVGNVVNDTCDAGAHLRLDEQHHAAVALGDEGLLHQISPLEPPQVALHDFVEPVLRLPGFGPQPSQHRAGVVQHLARRADGRADLAVQVAQLRDVAGQAG